MRKFRIDIHIVKPDNSVIVLFEDYEALYTDDPEQYLRHLVSTPYVVHYGGGITRAYPPSRIYSATAMEIHDEDSTV